ncbi:MAG: CoA ester lyase, partial [Anaerolineae bacterium]|nr:CoA ester lyase [Anaerolineae bacterium]
MLDEAGGQHLPLMAMIETPLAVLNAEEIAAVEESLICLVVNTNRLIAELGIQPTADRIGLVYHLSRVLLAGRAYDKQVIDGAHLNLRE